MKTAALVFFAAAGVTMLLSALTILPEASLLPPVLFAAAMIAALLAGMRGAEPRL